MSTSVSNETVLYHSTYEHGVDEKRRVQIPAKWRLSQPDVPLTIILWTDNSEKGACLRVMPPKQMQALMQKIETMSTSDPTAVALRRNFAAQSDTVTMDKAGRICIPEPMAKAAGIEKQAVLAGALQWFEIWNPDNHKGIRTVDDVLAPEAVKKI